LIKAAETIVPSIRLRHSRRCCRDGATTTSQWWSDDVSNGTQSSSPAGLHAGLSHTGGTSAPPSVPGFFPVKPRSGNFFRISASQIPGSPDYFPVRHHREFPSQRIDLTGTYRQDWRPFRVSSEAESALQISWTPNCACAAFWFPPTDDHYCRMRRVASAAAGSGLCLLGYLMTDCAGVRDVGLAERCAEIMQLAFPNAAIEIGKSDAAATSLTTIVAHVEGARTDMPAGGPLVRDLAVECRFDNNILTGFRWTAGPEH
jgi:hypothetical protein